MRESTLNTISVPLALAGSDGGAYNPGLVYQAGATKPTRLVLRNNSEAIDFTLAFDAATLLALPVAGGTYVLPAGASDVFVLAPGQKMYAIANGTGGKLSIAASEALPLDLKP